MDAITKFIIMIVAFVSFGALFVFIGFLNMRKYRLMTDTPTSKIRSMAMGIVEINAKANCRDLFTTPFSKSPCVYYRYEIKEYREKITRDSKGNTRRTRRWETIASGEKRQAFWGIDDTGKVPINPSGAEFNVTPKKIYLQKAGLFGGLTQLVGMLKNWDNTQQNPLDVSTLGLTEIDNKKMRFSRVGDRKYFEYFIAPEEPIYVLGTAKNEQGNVLIKKGENEKTFLISNKSEKELVKGLKFAAYLWLFLGGGLLSAAIIISIIRATSQA